MAIYHTERLGKIQYDNVHQGSSIKVPYYTHCQWLALSQIVDKS